MFSMILGQLSIKNSHLIAYWELGLIRIMSLITHFQAFSRGDFFSICGYIWPTLVLYGPFSNVIFCAKHEFGVKITISRVLCPLKWHFEAILFADDFEKLDKSTSKIVISRHS